MKDYQNMEYDSIVNDSDKYGAIMKNMQAQQSGYGYEDSGSPFGTIDIWKLVEAALKWWWLIALITILSTALMSLYASRLTPIFSSTVILEIKEQGRNIAGTNTIEDINPGYDFFPTQIELLQSKTLAESVVENLNLLSDPDFIALEDETGLPISRDQRLRTAVAAYQGSLSVSAIGRSRLIQVSFRHPDNNKAALIANAIADNFIDTSLQTKFNSTAYAREFLENRLVTVKISLEAAERALVDYASENDIITLDSQNTQGTSSSLNLNSLVGLNAELTNARTERMIAEQTYLAAQNEGFPLEVLKNISLNALKEDLIELKSQYAKNLATFKPSFPEMIEIKSRIDLLESNISNETTKIVNANESSFKTKYLAAKAHEEDLSLRVNSLKNQVTDLRERSIEYTILEREVDTERAQYEALLQRFKDVSVSDDIGANLVEIVDKAQPANWPSSPNKPRMVALAFLLSGAIGYGIAYLIVILDDRIKQPDDVKIKLKKNILGVLPFMKPKIDIIEQLADAQSEIAEGYSALRANLQFSAIDGGPRIIQVTSTQPDEGKSVSSLGLALRYAGLGQPTLLIDADLRRPTFKAVRADALGLSELLTTRTEIFEHTQATSHKNLDFISAGPIAPNPSELLSSERFSEVLKIARTKYDYIVIDSPPVMGLADSPVLGAKVDATLLVVEANKLRANAIRVSIERLQISGTNLLGVILTKYKASQTGYRYYNYNYGKAGTDTSANSNGKNKRSDIKPDKKIRLT